MKRWTGCTIHLHPRHLFRKMFTKCLHLHPQNCFVTGPVAPPISDFLRFPEHLGPPTQVQWQDHRTSCMTSLPPNAVGPCCLRSVPPRQQQEKRPCPLRRLNIFSSYYMMYPRLLTKQDCTINKTQKMEQLMIFHPPLEETSQRMMNMLRLRSQPITKHCQILESRTGFMMYPCRQIKLAQI